MNHPKSRAERRKIKAKKEHFVEIDRAGHVQRRLLEEALEQKEILDGLRREVLTEETPDPEH